MPEGDTIFRAATVLRRALAGERLLAFEAPRLRFRPFPPDTVVEGVEARGKHLLITFGDRRVLHTHMRMSGSWHVYPAGVRRPGSDRGIRALVSVPRATAVCFRAPIVELLAEHELERHPRLATLGPDLCSPLADLDEILTRLSRLPPQTQIGVALLDQRVASGIGNVYKSEALFARGIDPFAPLRSLDPATLRNLYACASDLLRRNLGGGRRVTAPGGTAVYRRTGRACPRCGTPIASRRQGDAARTTYWCPACQATPLVAGTGAPA